MVLIAIAKRKQIDEPEQLKVLQAAFEATLEVVGEQKKFSYRFVLYLILSGSYYIINKYKSNIYKQ